MIFQEKVFMFCFSCEWTQREAEWKLKFNTPREYSNLTKVRPLCMFSQRGSDNVKIVLKACNVLLYRCLQNIVHRSTLRLQIESKILNN